MSRAAFALGAGAALGGRALLRRALLVKFNRDVRRLNAGDHTSLLSAYAEDAVLSFNDGEHRWAGEHVGKPAIERFLRNYTAAGVQGEIKDMWLGGPLWKLSFVARFDDHVTRPDGTQLYANRTALVLRTRWGRVVEHEDFYKDTAPIAELDRRLVELGIAPVS